MSRFQDSTLFHCLHDLARRNFFVCLVHWSATENCSVVSWCFVHSSDLAKREPSSLRLQHAGHESISVAVLVSEMLWMLEQE